MSSKKFPSFSQWKQLFKTLKKTERIFLGIFVFLFLASGIYLSTVFYFNKTEAVPAYGGKYIEGIVGQPRFINPIYGEANDVDRVLIDLIYSGLMTYDKNGNIVNDLAESYQISEDGKTYVFELKNNIYWHDGVPLTVEDIIFTIKTIQNSEYKSPLRANWLDVGVEKVSEKSIAFFLSSSYNSFLENTTVKIMPQHLWKNVVPQNFALSSYNLQPVGSGIYTISRIEQANTGFIKNIDLTANRRHHDKTPYITNFSLRFFENKNDLLKAVNQRTINGFSIVSLQESSSSVKNQIKQKWNQPKFNSFYFSMPRYFSVFFNSQKAKILSDDNLRKALNYSVNKKEIVENISNLMGEKITVVDSPILPKYFGFQEPSVIYEFNQEIAKELLDKSEYKLQENGIRTKQNEKKPAFQFKSYLKIGSKGSEVVELQGCLARLDSDFSRLLQEEESGTYGKGTGEAVTAFQEKYLPEANSTGETGPSTRVKLNELCISSQNEAIPLQFTLTTINQPQLVKVAEYLKNYWKEIGVLVEIKAVEFSELKEIIKNRNYDALLYGQALGAVPDLYPFWHSNQVFDPGLNLADYKNKDADQLLKDARETLSAELKKEKYEKLQNIILNDVPALFLYNSDYIYWASEKIKGISTERIIDPAKRFSNIENWYIKTKRTWK
jgi:peptide/nickel transport system substrate-binding protein